jgi:hypothetical protein
MQFDNVFFSGGRLSLPWSTFAVRQVMGDGRSMLLFV